MNNRLGGKESLSKEEIQKRINIIFTNAIDIYNLMPFGMTLEIDIPAQPDIIVPNKDPESKKLIITKPITSLRIHPE